MAFRILQTRSGCCQWRSGFCRRVPDTVNGVPDFADALRILSIALRMLSITFGKLPAHSGCCQWRSGFCRRAPDAVSRAPDTVNGVPDIVNDSRNSPSRVYSLFQLHTHNFLPIAFSPFRSPLIYPYETAMPAVLPCYTGWRIQGYRPMHNGHT